MAPRRIGTMLAFVLLAAACGAEPKETGTKIQAEVNLPGPFKPPALAYPAQYDGGIFSVVGLKRALTYRRGPKIMDTNQTVRGYVVRHYENPCPKSARDCLGKEPHFWIADAMDSKTELTVVPSWKIDGEKLKKMYEVGQTYDFKGRFAIQAGNGFADAAGLLNVDCPPEVCPEMVQDPTAVPPGMLPKRPPLQ